MRQSTGRRSKRAATLLGLGLALFGPAGVAPAAAQADLAGSPVVTAIEVQPAPGRDPAEFLRLVRQPVGEPLSRGDVALTIQALFNTGEFADIQAISYPAAGGVRLVFQTRPAYFIALLRFEHAPEPPTDAELADASGLELGQIYTRGGLDQAAAKIETRLRGYGYYQARVTPRATLDPRTAQAILVFDVAAGLPARIGAISFSGNPLFTRDRLLRAAKLKPGLALPRRGLDQAITDLQSFYGSQNRLTAAIRVATDHYDPATNRLDATIAIDPGPLVAVNAEGIVLSRGLLKKEVPIYQEHAADDALVEEGRRNLAAYLQNRGYFEATVDYHRTTPRPGELRILYLIAPGPRETLEAIHFSGNQYFDSDTLGQRIAIRASSGLPDPVPGARGRYSNDLAKADADAIARLYRANGFLAARVTPQVNRDYQGKANHIDVVFQVAEGPQTRVRRVALNGVAADDQARLLAILGTASGQPYADASLVGDRDAILTYYYNAGHAAATCQTHVTPVPGANQVDVDFQVAEGAAETVHDIFINGDHYVRRSAIAHQLRLGPGQPLSQVAMLDSQRNLYNSGLFTDVSVAPRNPDGLELAKDVQVTVNESRRYTFSEGIGMQIQGGTGSGELADVLGKTGYSPLLSFDVTRMAVGGRDQTLSLKSTYGTLEKRVVLGYDVPQFLDHPTLQADVTTFYDDTFDVLTFRAIREQAGVQLEQSVGGGAGWTYGVDYRRVQVLSPLVAAQEIPILSQPVQLAEATINYHRDRRDNPLDSHHGTYNNLQLSMAASFGGDALTGQPPHSGFADFARGYYENSSYYSFGKRGQYVLARSTQVGVEIPMGRRELITTTNPVTGVSAADLEYVIPLPERFLSGGAESLRGFDINQAGPRDPVTAFPVGGDALLINNVEMRFPLISPVGGVVFYDLGNVYSTPGEMARSLLRWRMPSSVDQDFTSHTVGLGLRYQTPVGPVRLDTGYLLNPPSFQAFTAQPAEYLQRLPAFHFFFSIGQTF